MKPDMHCIAVPSLPIERCIGGGGWSVEPDPGTDAGTAAVAMALAGLPGVPHAVRGAKHDLAPAPALSSGSRSEGPSAFVL